MSFNVNSHSEKTNLMIYRKLFAATAFLICNFAYAQTPEVNLVNWAQKNPIEKVYLHLDRESYTSGQTIWLKAYFLSDYIPSVRSTTLITELLNSRSQVVLKQVFPAYMSESMGQIQLPDDLASGTYQLRAYSPIMLNQPGFFHSKKITVFGKPSKSTQKELLAPTIDITFFPEGGNLIHSLMNNVAFKAVDENGLPVNVVLEIKNNKNETVTGVSSSHDGMGYFSIVPQVQESYYAVIVNDPLTKKYTLPAPTDRGVTLSVKNSANGKSIKVEQLANNDTFKAAYMIGQMQNNIVFRQNFKNDKNLFGGTIQTRDLLSGILHITIFNKDGMPLAERLTFVDNKEYILPGALTVDTLNTNERKRNHYSILLPDTVIGNFSVSVTDADYELTEAREQNIYSYFLLSSDLKGYINNPAWYFSGEASRANSLDLVMMTNGWTRFRWEDATKNTPPTPVHKDNSFISLKGLVTVEGRKKPLANQELIYFITPTDTSQRKFGRPAFLQTDSMGIFSIDSMIFFGKMNILFSEIRGKKSKFIKVRLDSDSLYKNYNLPTVRIPYKDTLSNETTVKMSDHYNDYLRASGLMLENVTVKAKLKTKQEQLEEKYSSAMFSGGISSRFLDLSDETTGAQNIFDYIQGRIAGVNVIRNDMGEYTVSYRDGGLGNNRLQLYLDEVQTDAAFIEAIPVNQIAFVKLMGTFIGAPGGGGALAIYLKKGADLSAVTESATDIIPYSGYDVIKEFYSPNYDVRKPSDSKADNRLTLYWMPTINLAHVNPKIPVVFYNNDRTKKFKIVAEGVTNDGRFLMIEKIVNP